MTATMKVRRPGWLTQWTPDKVATAQDPVLAFAEYAQQTLGVPWPTIADLKILRLKINEFFEHYPRLNYFTLCRVVTWAKARHRRFKRVWCVVEAFRDAYLDGALPELDPNHSEASVEERITAALQVETSQAWRRILIGAQGTTTRREMLAKWETERGSTCGVH